MQMGEPISPYMVDGIVDRPNKPVVTHFIPISHKQGTTISQHNDRGEKTLVLILIHRSNRRARMILSQKHATNHGFSGKTIDSIVFV
ncbi:hypothetical protein JCGZ_11211 [Jatropha curcas]|uniref:Uncharacterized protein n=1 Tax=Jatropha curcas TaxID=180498 RepID=A0A067KRY4_JATCU|nr:hypothetical protein JCGZ_11211 [Jatropha curcas]